MSVREVKAELLAEARPQTSATVTTMPPKRSPPHQAEPSSLQQTATPA